MRLKDYVDNQFMYLATINSPFIISLLTEPTFNELLKRNLHQKIGINWGEEKPDKWIIVVTDRKLNKRITINFTLPKLLIDYMMSNDDLNVAAKDIKERKIGTFVFLAYLDKINPTLCTLKFDWEMTRKTILKLKDKM